MKLSQWAQHLHGYCQHKHKCIAAGPGWFFRTLATVGYLWGTSCRQNGKDVKEYLGTYIMQCSLNNSCQKIFTTRVHKSDFDNTLYCHAKQLFMPHGCIIVLNCSCVLLCNFPTDLTQRHVQTDLFLRTHNHFLIVSNN